MVRVFPTYSSPLQPEVDSVSSFRTMMNVVVPESFPHELFVTCQETERTNNLGIFLGKSPFHYPFTLLLFEMSFVIVTTRIIRFLLKPLKQPRIISEIIGGIIIGPSILGRNKNFASRIYPINAQYVIKNMGIMGFMYFLFVTGVKMDLSLVIKSGKKQRYIALIGVTIPFLATTAVAVILRPSMDEELAKFSSIGAITSNLAITSFPVLYPILRELNLLSSEVGRMALSTAIISDAIGLNVVVAFEAAKQGEGNPKAALWYLISLVILLAFMVVCIRKIMIWIIQKTGEGKQVDSAFIVAILAGVLVIGFLTDMFGMAIANGPMWLGLVIPDGPPLGAILVDRSETIMMDILMPLSFTFVGLYTDVFAMSSAWHSLKPVFFITLTGYFSKFVVTLMASLFFQMPIRDGIAFSLVMSLRGHVELLLFIHWMDKRIIKTPAFTLMVLLTTAVTAIVTPLIRIFYNPLKPYMINKRRNIQHNPSEKELRILVCIHDEESLPGLINLLEVSSPSVTNPFSVYALHLIELVGRAFPVLIDHENQNLDSKYSGGASEVIHKSLELYQETRSEFVKLHIYTSFSPKRTMYQDICELGLVNKVSLIIVPFHKDPANPYGGQEIMHGEVLHSLNLNVLAHAPCSVGILVDKGHFNSQLVGNQYNTCRLTHHFAVLFLGGPDAREALCYADRMAGNPNVYLTVIRFLPYNYEGDNELEKKLDDGVVTWFWVKNEAKKKVIYREVVVSNGEQTLAAIQAMNDNTFDLWIMGRKQGINPVILEGLTDWSENQELGVVGDFVASVDFGGVASVLIIQQQILRGQRTNGSRRHKFSLHSRPAEV